jgi:chemotaxis signal transduction protein
VSERPVLTDQECALGLYLDALFAPMREAATATGTPPVTSNESATSLESVGEARLARPANANANANAGNDRAADVQAPTPGISVGFHGECLIAEHHSLRLALPMQALAAILPAPEQYARLPGQAAWLHGVIRHRDQNVPVVSPDLLAGRDLHEVSTPGPGDARVVVLGSGRWAVHLEHTAGTSSVEPTHYRLRESRDRLPWLAGFITDGLVSLIDVAELEQWLDEKGSGTDPAKDTAEDSPSGR